MSKRAKRAARALLQEGSLTAAKDKQAKETAAKLAAAAMLAAMLRAGKKP